MYVPLPYRTSERTTSSSRRTRVSTEPTLTCNTVDGRLFYDFRFPHVGQGRSSCDYSYSQSAGGSYTSEVRPVTSPLRPPLRRCREGTPSSHCPHPASGRKRGSEYYPHFPGDGEVVGARLGSVLGRDGSVEERKDFHLRTFWVQTVLLFASGFSSL